MDSMQSSINAFLAFGAFEKNFSEHTVSAYRMDLNQFMGWMEERGGGIAEISHHDVSDFLAYKSKNGYEFSSIARALFCLRSFFDWFQAEGGRKDNPTELLQSPKLWSSLPELLSPEEIDTLIRSVDGQEKMVLRNRAILELLYGCGLRVGELVGLRLENIDLQEGVLRCLGKGRKERLIPLGKKARKALALWLQKGRPAFPAASHLDTLFISQKGTPLSRQHVWLEIQRLARFAGISKKVYPHIFRHSFATHLLAGGADLRVLQELLGHADIATTQRYTQVNKGNLIKQFRRLHPRG
jgi:integrase/recombinase XerD